MRVFLIADVGGNNFFFCGHCGHCSMFFVPLTGLNEHVAQLNKRSAKNTEQDTSCFHEK